MNRIAKNYIYNVLYQVFLIIVPIITAPYLTKVFSPECLGEHAYINSVVGVITTVGLLGLNTYGYRQIAYYKDDQSKTNETVTEIFVLRVFLLLIISAVYFPIILNLQNRLFYIIQYMLILSQFVDVSWIFIGYEDLGIVSFRNFIAKLLTVIGTFIFIKSDEDLWIYFLLFSITTLISVLSVYGKVKKYVSFTKIKYKNIFSHLKYSIMLFLPSIAMTLFLQCNKIIIELLTNDTAQVAYYEYAEKIINISLGLITALSTVMMPKFANLFQRGENELIKVYLKKTIKFAMYLSIPMAFGIVAISKGFISWYLDDNYQEVALLLVCLSPMVILNALSNVLGMQYLTAANKTKALNASYYAGLFLNVVLNFVLVPHFGCVGSAISTVISSALLVVIQAGFIKKQIGKLHLFKTMIFYLLYGIIMFVAVMIISNLISVSILSTIIEVIMGAVVFFLLTFVTKDEICLIFINNLKRITKMRNKREN